MKNKLILSILFFMLISSTSICAEKAASEEAVKEYDGIWFLGFNLKKDLFGNDDGRVVRQSFAMAIERGMISSKIIGDDTVPAGVIPPGMEGYDPTLKGYPYDLGLAKKMMRSVGYQLNDRRIKNLTILHTDGKKTLEIVDRIKMDLVNLGVDMTRTEVSYSDLTKWRKLLASGKYDLFVMGYKAGSFGELFIGDKDAGVFHTFTCYLNPTDEAKQQMFDKYEDAVKAGYSPCSVCKPKLEKTPSTLALLQPLFHSEGEANFTFYSNKRVDTLIDEIAFADKNKKLAIYEKLNEIDRAILDDCPVVPLFYITRL